NDQAKDSMPFLDLMTRLLPDRLAAIGRWQSHWPTYEIDSTLRVSEDHARAALHELTERLEDNYPFFHPDYAGQMLKPPHAIASIAYFLAQQINPNNHALDRGPQTRNMHHQVTV